MTPDELLDRAADEMSIRGSCTGTLEDNEGHVCMIGAVHKLFRYSKNPTLIDVNAYSTAMGLLETTLGGSLYKFDVISKWNDSHTHDERIEALRGAAKYYRETQC